MRQSAIVPRYGLIRAIALVGLLLGAVGMSAMIGRGQPPPRQVVDHPGPLVRVASIQPQKVPATVTASGKAPAKHL